MKSGLTTPGRRDIICIYIVPVEEEEYAFAASREGRPMGCKATRERQTRKVALEGRG